MASRFVLPNADVGNGIQPKDGAKLNFFETGTSTRKDTFNKKTALPGERNANPVIADANGVFPDIFITGTYKVTLTDKNNVQTGFGEADPVDEFVNLSNNVFVKNFLTLEGGPAATSAVENTALASGDAVNAADRKSGDGGDAVWNVVLASSVTPNGFDIVLCIGVPTLALVLRDAFEMKQWGAVADGVNDDTNAALANFASATTELKQIDKLTIKGFDHTGLFGAGRDGIGTVGLDINGHNGLAQSVTDYLSVICAYDDTTRPSNWSVYDINITSPFVPQKDGTVFPGLGLADDHFGYVNRGGKNHIVSGIRILGGDDGVSHMFGDVGVDLAREVQNGVYSDAILDDISNLGLQIDSARYAVFNNYILRGNEHNLPISEFPGAAMGHGIRLLSQQGIDDVECRFVRVTNAIVDNWVNGMSIQTGTKNCLVEATMNHTKRLIDWKEAATPNNLKNSIRVNDFKVSFFDTQIGLTQETSFFNRYLLHGEACTGLLSNPTITGPFFDPLEHNDYDLHGLNISQNAVGLKSSLSHVKINIKGLLANATNRPFIIDSDCNRSKIDIIASEFNLQGVYTANSCIVTLIQLNSGGFDLDGDGNFVNRIDSSSRFTITGSNNVIKTAAREIRDVAGTEHNTLIANTSAVDSNNPHIISGSFYSLNLMCSAITTVSTAVTISGNFNSGNITAHHVDAICCAINGDNNNLMVAAKRDDANDAVTVGGDENNISITTNGVIRVTGDNNVVSGVCRAFTDTGTGNDTSNIKAVP